MSEIVNVELQASLLHALPDSVDEVHILRDDRIIRIVHRPAQTSQDDMDARFLAAATALHEFATAKHTPPPFCTPYVTARIWSGEREPLICPVCLDAIPALEELAVLCCGHHYHLDCARRLQSCAICRV